MSKKSITKNYIYNVMYQLLIIILPIITTPYLSRILGAENIGIYSYTLSIVTYFILFGSLGIAMYAQREIAYVQDDKEKRSKIFWEIIILRIITMSISMVIFYLTYINGTEYTMYYKILLLEMVSTCFDISWFFQGLEDFKKTVLRNVIIRIISILLIFILIKSPNDLVLYFVIYVSSNLIGNLSLWLYLPKYLKKVKKLNIIQHIKPTIGLFIPQIAMQIYTVLDKVMIGSIVPDKSEVGYYDQSQKIIKLLLTIVTSLGTVMIPRMAKTFAEHDKNKIKEYLQRAFNFVFFLAIPMMFGVISIAEKFVPIFFGDGYGRVIELMQVISPIFIAIGLSNVIGSQYLLPTKRQKEFTISVTIGAFVNIVMNLILIRKMGAKGASIATVIAEFSVTLVQFYFVRKDINLLKILKMAIPYIFMSIIMFIVCALIDKFVIVNALVNVVMQIIIGASIYFFGLYIIKDEFYLYILAKVRNILKLTK